MNVVGQWILHFDWGCTGTYSQTPITFAGDQTFNVPDFGETGLWTQDGDKLMFRFDAAPNSVYDGDGVSAVMVGISSAFTGVTGCWYATQSGLTTLPVSARAPAYTPSGKKV
jgi:hypothetical protein